MKSKNTEIRQIVDTAVETDMKGPEKKLQDMETNLAEVTKNMQPDRVSCGGYKEELKHLLFSGLETENSVQLLKNLEQQTARVNPLMDNEDKFDIINRVLKGWAATWWKVAMDGVTTYEGFKQNV